MPYYAQIDEDNIVIGISNLSQTIELQYMIPIAAEDISLLGKKYENGTFVEGPPPIEIVLPRHITVGAFKDRLGINSLALAVSSDPVCVAMREMLYDRSFVDLDRADLRTYLMMLVNNNLPEARTEFPGSGPLTEQMVDDILSAEVQDYERP